MKPVNLALTVSLFAVLVSAKPVSAAQAYDPSDDLNLFFGARCDSYNGALNNLANAQSGYLKSVVASMMDDPACAGVSKALKDLDRLNIDELQAESEASLTVEQLRDQSQRLEATLRAEEFKQPVDTAYIADIKLALRDVNINLVKARSLPTTEAKQRRLNTLNDLQKYSIGLFSELEKNAACSGKHPNIGAQIGSQVVALSSHLASAFMGPVLLAAGSITDRFVTYMRNRPLAHQYRKVVDARMTQAIGCGLESLSSTYCQARDLQAVIKYSSSNQQVQASCNPEDQGARLIGTELASFSNWVSRVNAGSAPSSPAQGSEKKDAVQLKADFDKLKIELDGKIAKTSRKLSAGGVDVRSELTGLLKDVESSVKASVGKNIVVDNALATAPGPLASVFANDPNCGPMAFLYTNGAENECRLNSPSETCLQCVQRVFGGGGSVPKVPTLVEIVAAKDLLIARAGPTVAAEAALNQESNPQLVLTKAFGLGANRRRPVDFLVGTKTYLEYLVGQKTFASGARMDTILDLQKRVNSSLCVLQPPNGCPPPSPTPSGSPSPLVSSSDPTRVAADKVTLLADNLSPSRDIFYISNSLYELVKQDLDERIANGSVDESLALVMQLSTSDSLGELVTNQIGLDASNTKAIYAKEQTMKNLQSLGDLFNDQIVDGLKNAQKEKSDSFALDCARAMIIPGAPKLGRKNITEICAGQTWRSIRDPDRIYLSFDEIAKLPASERACKVYDFYRKSRVRETKPTN